MAISQSLTIILKNKDINIIEYLYLNKNQISSILYNEDKNIIINRDYLTKFSDYYYLYFLIKNDDLLEYIIDIEVIYNLYEMIIEEKGIKKIVLTKILLQLIENKLREVQDKEEEKCKKIKKNCFEIINYEKNTLKKYNIYKDLNELNFHKKEIDEIYDEIIISLIKNNKLDNSFETINLLKELDIKNLRLNEKILKSLMGVLVEDNLKPYLISSYNDLFDENKLFFYHTLLVYILKSSDYIFHIPFLLKTREKIIRIINQHIDEFSLDLKERMNCENIIKLKKVLNYFIDLEYYVNKSDSDSGSDDDLKCDNHSEDSFLNDNYSYENSYEPSSFEFNKDIAYKFMSESTFTISLDYNKEKNEVFIEYKKIICEQDEYQIEDVKNIKSEDEIIDNNYRKFIKFLEHVENELKIYYRTEKKIEIDLKFNIDNINDNSYNVSCNYKVNDDDIIEKCFIDKDILDNNNNGLIYLIDSINYYKNNID